MCRTYYFGVYGLRWAPSGKWDSQLGVWLSNGGHIVVGKYRGIRGVDVGKTEGVYKRGSYVRD